MVDFHLHTDTDSPKLDAKFSLINCPQTSLTTKNMNALSTGGAAVLSVSDNAIIDNMRTRINELEAKLTSIGFIR